MNAPYRKSFEISANTSNIKPHDAIMLTSDSVSAGVGASYSAEIVTFGEQAQYGAGGRPRQTSGNYTAPVIPCDSAICNGSI